MEKNNFAAIIDLKISNLHNVKLACDIVGIPNIITSNPKISKHLSLLKSPNSLLLFACNNA